MKENKSPLLETTSEVVSFARLMIRQSSFGALGTLELETGYPQVTRVNCAPTPDGHVIFLLSDLAAHSKALKKDERTSLLIGEPGKGDALAHPRITLYGKTNKVVHEDHLRVQYLAHHPKAGLYNDLPDFFLYQFTIERALLNAGFGKAYQLTGEDLIRA